MDEIKVNKAELNNHLQVQRKVVEELKLELKDWGWYKWKLGRSEYKLRSFLYDEELEISVAFHIKGAHRVPRKENGNYEITVNL